MTLPLPNDELLSAYLDDELSPADRARVEERLATDSDYATTLEGLRNVRERLRALPKGSIDVRRAVMDQVSDQAPAVTREAAIELASRYVDGCFAGGFAFVGRVFVFA